MSDRSTLTETQAHAEIRSHITQAVELAAGLFPGDYGPHEFLPLLLAETAAALCPPSPRPPAPKRKRKPIPSARRAFVFDQANYQCQRCGNLAALEIDHIIPLSRGGSNDLTNLWVLCRPCNQSKGARTPEEMGW